MGSVCITHPPNLILHGLVWPFLSMWADARLLTLTSGLTNPYCLMLTEAAAAHTLPLVPEKHQRYMDGIR